MRNSIARENSNVYMAMDSQASASAKKDDSLEFEQLVDQDFAKKPINDDGFFNQH